MKVIFLDIDGVLQPLGSDNRFFHDIDQTVGDICREMGDDIYKTMDKYDVAAVKWDWDADAVALLEEVLEKSGAKIVIESDWRLFNDDKQMKALLRMHGLDGYHLCNLPDGPKGDVIRDYLDEHADEVEAYVVVDDRPVLGFNHEQIETYRTLAEDDAKKMLSRLNAR